jgi:hypothetical protein
VKEAFLPAVIWCPSCNVLWCFDHHQTSCGRVLCGNVTQCRIVITRCQTPTYMVGLQKNGKNTFLWTETNHQKLTQEQDLIIYCKRFTFRFILSVSVFFIGLKQKQITIKKNTETVSGARKQVVLQVNTRKKVDMFHHQNTEQTKTLIIHRQCVNVQMPVLVKNSNKSEFHSRRH